jgi:hypothetical protein
MASLLQQTADRITQAAGWTPALADEKGIFHFFLEGNLDFDLFSPEGRTGILYAFLGNLPAQESLNSDEYMHRIAALAAGSLKKRRSVFSVGDHGMELHRSFSLMETDPMLLLSETRDFLNDLAWWKKQLSSSKNTVQSDMSPFSINFNGCFSNSLFNR